MAIMLTTTNIHTLHEVIDIIGAIGSTRKVMFSKGPILGDALNSCKENLREKASEIGADALIAIRFETTYYHDTINIVGYGTAIRWL